MLVGVVTALLEAAGVGAVVTIELGVGVVEDTAIVGTVLKVAERVTGAIFCFDCMNGLQQSVLPPQHQAEEPFEPSHGVSCLNEVPYFLVSVYDRS